MHNYHEKAESLRDTRGENAFTRFGQNIDPNLHTDPQDPTLLSSIEHLHGPEQIESGTDDLIVTCLVRDGRAYISDFIDHYLSLGVKHLVFLDNGSEDETVAMLRNPDNVTVLRSMLPFKQYKIAMKRYLVERFGSGRWVLYVDVDELFDYPYSDIVSLSALLRYLNRNSYTAVVAQMLDMFSDLSISEITEEKTSLKETHRWYDIASVRKIDYDGYAGGTGNTLSDNRVKVYRAGIQQALFGHPMLITKHPLVFIDGEIEPMSHSSHWVSNARIADFTGVLFHYKFSGNFRKRTLRAVEEENYSNNSAKYKKYLHTIENNPDLRLVRASSREIKDVNDLVAQQFLTVSEDYMMLVDEEDRLNDARSILREQPGKLASAFSISRVRAASLQSSAARLRDRVRENETRLAETQRNLEAVGRQRRNLSLRLQNASADLSKRDEQLSLLKASTSWKVLQAAGHIKSLALRGLSVSQKLPQIIVRVILQNRR